MIMSTTPPAAVTQCNRKSRRGAEVNAYFGGAQIELMAPPVTR